MIAKLSRWGKVLKGVNESAGHHFEGWIPY